MLEFGRFKNNELLEVRPAHKLTKNYDNPPISWLISNGWLPVYYDIPEYNKETHMHSGYTFTVENDKAIAHAVIIEIEEDEL